MAHTSRPAQSTNEDLVTRQNARGRSAQGWILAGLLAQGFIGSAVHASDDVVLWYASRSAAAKTNWLWGETQCAPGSVDCNPCMPEVERQFRESFDQGAMSWQGKQWHFAWVDAYAPSELSPNPAYIDESGSVIRTKHVQGFVRTNVAGYPLAMTHSGEHIGSVSIITESSSGRKSLAAMHETISAHPGSLATIGTHVLLPDSNHVRFIDVSRPAAPQDVHHSLPGPIQINSDVNGGIGMAKLRSGGHLVIFLTGGQTNPASRKTVFVYHEGPFASPNRMEYLGEYPLSSTLSASSSSIKTWEGAKFPENTSMISECGTGTLYTVHFGSGTTSLNGTAVIHLARVDWGSTGPMTTTVGLYTHPQDDENCFFEGGASAGSVDYWKPGKLRILCHERVTKTEQYFNFFEGTNGG